MSAFCHATDHHLINCPVRVCKHCRQRCPGYYLSNCPRVPTRQDTSAQSTAATAGVSSTTSTSPTLIDVSDLPALVRQILSASGNPSIASSVSSGSGTPVYVMCCQLSSSSAPSYLIDPSIELFPEDVDIHAVLPDDASHDVTIALPDDAPNATPPATVYTSCPST
ncbi:hypothetical protein Acr_10g0003320 [Actinidia rufa]|uniref:Uncharacterized protein n=1 Tax=Actinidia rufa TaxID=165716 RepID=A0A7J0FAM2_9ERIC|nr:hypothetical protein Acr_10g0003320 [Actinidia rufa]